MRSDTQASIANDRANKVQALQELASQRAGEAQKFGEGEALKRSALGEKYYKLAEEKLKKYGAGPGRGSARNPEAEKALRDFNEIVGVESNRIDPITKQPLGTYVAGKNIWAKLSPADRAKLPSAFGSYFGGQEPGQKPAQAQPAFGPRMIPNANVSGPVLGTAPAPQEGDPNQNVQFLNEYLNNQQRGFGDLAKRRVQGGYQPTPTVEEYLQGR